MLTFWKIAVDVLTQFSWNGNIAIKRNAVFHTYLNFAILSFARHFRRSVTLLEPSMPLPQ